jgi:hypothetical protein
MNNPDSNDPIDGDFGYPKLFDILWYTCQLCNSKRRIELAIHFGLIFSSIGLLKSMSYTRYRHLPGVENLYKITDFGILFVNAILK